MHPVMGRRYQKILQNAQFLYCFGMHQDPVSLGNRVHNKNIEGLKTQKDERYKPDETIHRLKYRRAETGCEIKTLRGMVCHMNGPEKAHHVVNPVDPVENKIFRQEQKCPVVPGPRVPRNNAVIKKEKKDK
ncbi:hypothetical protein D3C86_1560780 [compost metagenome]